MYSPFWWLAVLAAAVRRIVRVVLAAVPLLGFQSAFAAPGLPDLILDDRPSIGLGPFLEAFEDPDGRMTLEQVREQDGWQRWESDQVSLGFTSHAWWFRVSLGNPSARPDYRLLEVGYPSIDDIQFFLMDGDRVIDQVRMGDHLPFHARPITHHHFVLPLDLDAATTSTLYIRVQTSGVLQLPLTLWQRDAFSTSMQGNQLIAGMYFGIMLIMLVYNLVVFFVLRHPSYLAYVGFVLAIPMFVSSLTGYSYQYFWPDAPFWNERSIGFFLSLAILFGTIFTHLFLELGRNTWPRWVTHIQKFLYGLAGAMVVVTFAAPYTAGLITIICSAVLMSVCAMTIGMLGWMRGEVAARHYINAWGSLLIGGIILAGNKFSLLPQNLFTDNAVQIGSALLVALLSVALADRVNRERRRRYQAQREALQHERQARAAKEQALRAQEEANRELERKVAERTEALREANRQLQRLSTTDGLTGLKNRRYFDQESRREFARSVRHGHTITLVFIDIDHFKSFNDTHGHVVGDEVLQRVGQVLMECAGRETDVIARYGGEEFCILLPETDAEGAHAVAERIRVAIEHTEFLINGTRVPLTISLGLASMAPQREEQLADLIRRADEALYRAKAAGRNRVALAEEA